MIGAHHDGATLDAAIDAANLCGDLDAHQKVAAALVRLCQIAAVGRWVRRHPCRCLGTPVGVCTTTAGAGLFTLRLLLAQGDIDAHGFREAFTPDGDEVSERGKVTNLAHPNLVPGRSLGGLLALALSADLDSESGGRHTHRTHRRRDRRVCGGSRGGHSTQAQRR